jgi:hypothetical protein
MQMQLPHDIAAMRIHSFHTQCQMRGYLLAGFAFSQKLDDFSFPT